MLTFQEKVDMVQWDFCDAEIRLYACRVSRKVSLNGHYMTPDEARKLAQSLVSLASIVEQE